MTRTISSRNRSVVLVCRKCSKKVGGGFGKGGDKALTRELRKLGNGGKGRKSDLLVMDTGCLKLCPKNAVVAVNAAQPDEWLIVPPGTDMDTVASKLGLPQPGHD